jgi:hypothetical protein
LRIALKNQPGFPRRFGKSLYSAVKLIAVPVETNTFNTNTKRLLRNRLAYYFSSFLITAIW